MVVVDALAETHACTGWILAQTVKACGEALSSLSLVDPLEDMETCSRGNCRETWREREKPLEPSAENRACGNDFISVSNPGQLRIKRALCPIPEGVA